MIEIKPEDVKQMWVWNSKDTKEKRLVLAKIKDRYLAVEGGYENEFFTFDDVSIYLKTWKYAKPIKKKLTAVAESAEEITGIEGAKSFNIEVDGKLYHYNTDMNNLAGKRIVIWKSKSWYDYISEKYNWLKNWLKNFREEEE